MPDNRRREHRIALALAIIAGAIVAMIIAYGSSCHGDCRPLSHWLNYETADAALWATIGGFLTGAAIYCARVFLRP